VEYSFKLQYLARTLTGATCLFVEWFDEENHGRYDRIESI